MDTSLQYVQDSLKEVDFDDGRQELAFNVLRATLQFSANPEATGRKLTDDIIFLTTARARPGNDL